jgi:transposase
MAQITQLPESIHAYDFVYLARQESHARTRERLLGMAHLQTHGSLTRTAKALFVNINTVQNWLNRFRRDGLVGLQEKPRAGRPRHLTLDQLAQVANLIKELEGERTGGRVKGKDIQESLFNRFGVWYHF